MSYNTNIAFTTCYQRAWSPLGYVELATVNEVCHVLTCTFSGVARSGNRTRDVGNAIKYRYILYR